jgi:FtsH-binding integral membrane protein
MSKYLQQQRATEWAMETNAFIGKTYRLLVLSLMAGACAVWLGLKMHIGMADVWPLVIADIAVLILAFSLRRVPGLNFAALFAVTGASGLLLSIPVGMLINMGYGALLLPAFMFTAALFTLLSIYVHLKESDFSFWGGFLFTGLCVLLAGWGFASFFPVVPFAGIVWAGAGVLLFSAYILFDTSMLINHLGPDDAVQGALSLYLDIFGVLFDLLRMILDIVTGFFRGSGDGIGDTAFGFDLFDIGDLF